MVRARAAITEHATPNTHPRIREAKSGAHELKLGVMVPD